MAEATGLVLAVLGAFNNAVQCYEYIQIARDFDQNFQTAILKLDIAKLRLSRWGHSIGLDCAELGVQTLPDVVGSQSDHEQAKALLEQIVQLFEEAERNSIKSKLPEKDSRTYNTTSDLDQATTSLHKKLERLSIKRFKPGNILKKTKWALYKEKNLNRLIQDTTELVDALVELFSAAHRSQKQLCEEEGSVLALDENASLLIPLVAEIDQELNAAIKFKSSDSGQIFNITFAGSENHGLQQGYFSGHQTNHFGGRS